jgi:hypothetical protein
VAEVTVAVVVYEEEVPPRSRFRYDAEFVHLDDRHVWQMPYWLFGSGSPDALADG